ncbi:MAG TPA: electron transfer flavoprotein subunit beta/FixA family protein [Deltaproteobacteria bacterium]|nr:electron transfer flavoprotein subunit beta/FixA family protein [Deltaproteobacteria bacterium]
MDILVCMKQVPDTEADIRPTADMTAIDYTGVKFIVNVYDEYAVEEALRLKEKVGGKVTIVSLGPDRAVEAIRTALAMGADEAVHLNDPALFDGDAYTTARALAKAIEGMSYDVIFCGKQAIDDDLAQVGSILGEFLGLQTVTGIMKFELLDDGKKARVHRQVEGGLDVLEVPLPAIFTATKGLNEPRYPSLPGIMKAKKKPLKTVGLGDLGLSEEEVGAKGALTKVLRYSLPPMRQAGKIIDGETPEEKAAKLAKLLREEAKVI